MARLTLSSRVEKWWPKLSGRNLEQLPVGLDKQLSLLLRDMGITRAEFLKLKPSTRAKYVRAAKQGRTVTAERERVRGQRAARKAVKQPDDIDTRGRKLDRIMRARKKLIEEYAMDTGRGENTQVDQVEAEILLSYDSIVQHIAIYGIDYVLARIEEMVDAVEQPGVGARNWGAFNASRTTDDDERWYWYHSQAHLYPQPFGGYPG